MSFEQEKEFVSFFLHFLRSNLTLHLIFGKFRIFRFPIREVLTKFYSIYEINVQCFHFFQVAPSLPPWHISPFPQKSKTNLELSFDAETLGFLPSPLNRLK